MQGYGWNLVSLATFPLVAPMLGSANCMKLHYPRVGSAQRQSTRGEPLTKARIELKYLGVGRGDSAKSWQHCYDPRFAAPDELVRPGQESDWHEHDATSGEKPWHLSRLVSLLPGQVASLESASGVRLACGTGTQEH